MKTLLWAVFPAMAFCAQPLPRPVPVDVGGAGHSSAPVITADGTHVLFSSDAANLPSGVSANGKLQIYLSKLATSNMVLVSVNAEDAAASANSMFASASADGAFVAFVTDAPDIAPGVTPTATNSAYNLYLRDVASGTSHLVTRGVDGTAAQGASRSWMLNGENVFLSRDAEWLFFESRATNLTTADDFNGVSDVFAYHRPSGTNWLVARSYLESNTAPANGARLMSITPDGRRVAFLSASPDIVAGVNNSLGDIYVLDMKTGEKFWASPLSLYLPTDYICVSAALSENGAFVALSATATNYPSMLFRRNLSAATTEMIASNINITVSPRISSSGDVILFEDGTNVYQWSAAAAETQVINLVTNGAVPVAGRAMNACMSADGRQVCFVSDSPGLTTNSPGGVFQVYCRDVVAGETWLVTQTPAGAPSMGSAEFSGIDIARDGSFVAFDTPAADLAIHDNNGAADVYIWKPTSGAPSLLSLRDESRPRETALGHAFATSGCISSNGQQLAWLRWNLDPLTNGSRPMQNAQVFDFPSATGVSPAVTNAVRAAAISGNGRFLVLRTSQPQNGTNVLRVSRFDRISGQVVDIAEVGDPWSATFLNELPAISHDGNLVAHGHFNAFEIYNVADATVEFSAPGAIRPLLAPTPVDAIFTRDGRFVIY